MASLPRAAARRLFTIAAIAVAAYAPLALSQAINCSTQIYGVTLSGTLAAINISNAVATTLGTTPVNLTELEYDSATGQMWATDGGAGNLLRRLNPATGAEITTVMLNPAGKVTGMEFVGGTLYGAYSLGTGSPSSLVTLDTTTGNMTTIGGMGLSVPISGLAYDATSSTMYGVTAGGQAISALMRINMTTGAATFVGAMGNYTKVGGLEFGPDGNLYAGIAPDGMIHPGGILRINTATGAPTLVGLTGLQGFTGLAACTGAAPPPPPPPPPPPQPSVATPVPTLSSVGLIALAIVVGFAGIVTRRRRSR